MIGNANRSLAPLPVPACDAAVVRISRRLCSRARDVEQFQVEFPNVHVLLGVQKRGKKK